MMRIVFMGSDAIALPALNWLAVAGSSVAEIVAVFTQPDRAVGRGQKVQPNEIKLWAEARGLPVLQPQKVGEAERLQLAAYKADLTLVMAYGHSVDLWWKGIGAYSINMGSCWSMCKSIRM